MTFNSPPVQCGLGWWYSTLKMTHFTNSAGEPITAGQFAFSIAAYTVGGAVALALAYAFTVVFFCL